jgi:hypothetical protein
MSAWWIWSECLMWPPITSTVKQSFILKFLRHCFTLNIFILIFIIIIIIISVVVVAAVIVALVLVLVVVLVVVVVAAAQLRKLCISEAM